MIADVCGGLLRYQRVPGSLIEDMGELWAAFSPASGETHLINDESALVLECLADIGPASAAEVAQALVGDLGADRHLSAGDLEHRLNFGWAALLDAGLVRAVPDVGPPGGHPRPL